MRRSRKVRGAREPRMTNLPDFSTDEIAAANVLFERPWGFVKGVAGLDGLPPADRAEIAFAGRSNVGKSSLLNALVRNSTMARTSNTPGRTQELNFFTPQDRSFYLVDMPGYGYAKAPKDKVEAWTGLIKQFLRGRPNLARVFVLIDSRHGIKANDHEIMDLLDEAAVSYQIVLTKLDKISHAATVPVIAAAVSGLKKHPAAFPVVLATSSETGAGIETLRAQVHAVARDHAR
jgi:GTP-binding protein